MCERYWIIAFCIYTTHSCPAVLMHAPSVILVRTLGLLAYITFEFVLIFCYNCIIKE